MTKEIKRRIKQIQAGKVPDGYKRVFSGIVPTDWDEAKINDIADEIVQTAGEGKYETLSISAGVGFVNQAKKFGREMSGEQYSKYAVLQRGDFSYNKGNSNLYPQGCIYRLNNREKAAVPNVFESFRISAQDGDYYEQLFISGFLNKQLYSKINHGVRDDGLLNLTGRDFYSSYLPVPPLSEQHKIAEILMQCDRGIELKQSKIEELQKLKKACLSKMFPKEGYNVPELRFPGFTGAWEQRKLGEVLSLIKDGTHGTHKDVENGPLLLSAKNIKNGRINWDENDRRISQKDYESIHSKFSLNSGDVLLTIVGSIGETAILHDIEGITFQRSVAYLRPTKRIESNFLYSQIQTPKFRTELDDRKSTSAQPGIYLGDLSLIPVTFPADIKEQEAIGALFSNLDNLITLHQRELEETRKFKKP